jgi:hypothetical protein
MSSTSVFAKPGEAARTGSLAMPFQLSISSLSAVSAPRTARTRHNVPPQVRPSWICESPTAPGSAESFRMRSLLLSRLACRSRVSRWRRWLSLAASRR